MGRARPWWGLGDVWLGVPFIFIFVVVGTLAGIPFVGLEQLQDWLSSGDGELPLALLATATAGQQVGQGVWPFLVSKWKGRGVVADWRLTFKPIDPLIGLGTGIMATGAAGLVAVVAATVINLGDQAADNTQFLRDAKGSPWLYVLLVVAVIGAPLTEELLFRGLVLRAFEKRAGTLAAIVGSTALFTLLHSSGGGTAATIVLYSAIATVGAVLATVTVKVGRLWPAVFAHMVFNSIGAADALGLFD